MFTLDHRNAEIELDFLNYKPKNVALIKEPPSNQQKNLVKTIEDQYQNSLKAAIDSFFNDPQKQLNIIPKKSNIDLKRNLLKKWEKIDKRTEISIIEILSLHLFFLLRNIHSHSLNYRKKND